MAEIGLNRPRYAGRLRQVSTVIGSGRVCVNHTGQPNKTKSTNPTIRKSNSLKTQQEAQKQMKPTHKRLRQPTQVWPLFPPVWKESTEHHTTHRLLTTHQHDPTALRPSTITTDNAGAALDYRRQPQTHWKEENQLWTNATPSTTIIEITKSNRTHQKQTKHR